VKVHNLNPDLLAVGWVVGQLAETVQPFIPGLSGSFFVKATYRLQPDGPPLPWPDKPVAVTGDRPLDGDIKNGLAYASDFVAYKPRADFAIIGTAYPPEEAGAVFTASAQIGTISKDVAVIGPRVWVSSLFATRKGPGPAGPATAVPMRYTHAWGGPKSRLNPIGMGRHGPEAPRLEPAPLESWSSYRRDPDPAAFGPIPPDWPFRRAKVGTYSKHWKATRWPWLPLDFDWSHFNATAPDQWFDGYLRGDERVILRNMHRTTPVYETRLPGVRDRVFLEQAADVRGDGVSFREVPLDLDTLWIDMEAEQVVLVWRGRAPVLSTKLKDVRHLLALVEPLDAPPRPLADFAALLAAAQAPAPEPVPAAAAPPALDDECKQAAAAINKTAEKINRIAGELRGMRSQVDAKTAEVTQLASEKLDAEVARAQANGVTLVEPMRQLDPQAALALAAGKLQATADKLRAIPGSPPEKIAEIEAMVAQLKTLKIPEPPPMPPRPAATAPAPPEVFDIVRARRGDYVRATLQDLDFSGLDLSGIDFTGASFARSKFVGTRLVGTILRGCDLTHTACEKADFSRAVLDDADLTAATLEGARFPGASLAAATLAGLDLVLADFSNTTGTRPDFTGSTLVGAIFTGANLPRAVFSKARLSNADFSDAVLTSATLESTVAIGANFADATLTNVRAGQKSDFTHATFTRAVAAGGVWKEARFDRAQFARASLVRGLFEDASLRGADLDRCDLMKASFEDADLSQAVLTNANLLRVNFAGATLTDARLDGSNLYEAAFRDAVLQGATWEDANLKKSGLAHR
jgi:uncharacterized protein YjbI with pentapeptide repeats